MDAPISRKGAIAGALENSIDTANGWRGRCVNLYARAEKALCLTLLLLEPGKKPPMLVTKKVERLQALKVSSDAFAALEEFAPLLASRAALTHGTGKLWIDDKDKWLLTLEWFSGTAWQRRYFTDEEAKSFHDHLRVGVQRLESALGKIRND